MRALAFLAPALLLASPALAAEQPTAQEASASIPLVRPVLKQKAEPWRYVQLGGGLQVSIHGCAVFSFRDALAEWGYDRDPLTFIDELNRAGLLHDGRLEFGGVNRLHPELRSVRLGPGDGVSLELALAHMAAGSLVLLRFHDGNGPHWVFLSPHPGSDGSMMLRDPRYGTSVPIDTYADQRLDGMAVISRIEPTRLARN